VSSSDDVQAKNKEMVRAAFEAWRSGKSTVFDLLAPKGRWTIVGNSPVSRTYRQKLLDTVITPFNAHMSRRLIPTVRSIYADGNTGIVLFDAEGTARDGKPYRNTYTWFMSMEGGANVEVTRFLIPSNLRISGPESNQNKDEERLALLRRRFSPTGCSVASEARKTPEDS
jgi:uncharacterized protein